MAKSIKPLNIKDPEAYRLARALADRTGESLTQTVVGALREKAQREQRRQADPGLIEAIREIQREVAAMPVLDARSDEEILGYNEHGAFE